MDLISFKKPMYGFCWQILREQVLLCTLIRSSGKFGRGHQAVNTYSPKYTWVFATVILIVMFFSVPSSLHSQRAHLVGVNV